MLKRRHIPQERDVEFLVLCSHIRLAEDSSFYHTTPHRLLPVYQLARGQNADVWNRQFILASRCFTRYSLQARSQNWEKRLVASSCLSVRPSARNNTAPTGRIFVEFNIWAFCVNQSKKIKFHKNLTRITVTLHKDLCTFMIRGLEL